MEHLPAVVIVVSLVMIAVAIGLATIGAVAAVHVHERTHRDE